MYQVTLQQFSGPLEKLLSLVEAQELPITEISLAQVTNDFLRYTESLREEGDVPHGVLADFIVVASRLMLIKSKRLLPDITLTDEEEADIKDFTARLAFYQQMRPILRHLRAAYASPERAFARAYFLDAPLIREGRRELGVFYPARNANPEELLGALRALTALAARIAHEAEAIQKTIVSVEQKIKEIIARLAERTAVRLGELAASPEREQLIVSFLAVLHLAREQQIALEQETHFADIIVRKL